MDSNSYLPKQECQFLHLVMEELETYQSDSDKLRVLLFPPLPSRLRYLIHSHIEELPDLTTFSVGERGGRRVVVCYSDLRNDDEAVDVDPERCNSSWEEPTMIKVGKHKEEVFAKHKTSNQAHQRGAKRPDKPLYMPRAVRERLSLQKQQQPPGEQALTGPAAGSCIRTSPESLTPETTETTKSPSTSTQECLLKAADCIHKYADDSPALGPGEAESESEFCELHLLSLAHVTISDDDRHKEFSPCVPCTNLMEEIKMHLKEAPVSIEHTHNDFLSYMSVSINLDEFHHVIEIYDFPAVFKTDDLLDAFAEYSPGGMKIKWVDHTHALGVFASDSAANQALSISHPMLKARALGEGSKKAKVKAFRSAEFIQPVKERPKTDSAVAQRMVASALGLQKRSRVHRKPQQKTAVIH